MNAASIYSAAFPTQDPAPSLGLNTFHDFLLYLYFPLQWVEQHGRGVLWRRLVQVVQQLPLCPIPLPLQQILKQPVLVQPKGSIHALLHPHHTLVLHSRCYTDESLEASISVKSPAILCVCVWLSWLLGDHFEMT